MKERIYDTLCGWADATCTTPPPDYSEDSWVPGLDRLLTFLYWHGWGD